MIFYLKHYFHQLISGHLRSMKLEPKILLLQQRHTPHTYAIIHSFTTIKIGPCIIFGITKPDQKFNKKCSSFLLLQFNYGDLKHMEGIHYMKLKTWNNGNAVARFSVLLIKEPSFAGWCELKIILFKWYILMWVVLSSGLLN